MKVYTGVGSRELPEGMYQTIVDLGFKLAQEGWLLRSGAADGADMAFEKGCDDAGGEKQIFIPWHGFNDRYPDGRPDGTVQRVFSLTARDSDKALQLASTIHPAWDRLSRGAKALHARNCYQVLGRELDSPSQMLICWAKVDKHGDALGGTRTAWMLAKERGIRRFNLNIPADAARIQAWLK